MEKRINTQLYILIDKLSSKVNDDSSLGLLIGYSVAESLLNFNPVPYGREPRAFKEIWEIYSGLSKSLETVSDGVYPLITNLKKHIEPDLKHNITENEITNNESNLLALLVSSLKRKNTSLEEYFKNLGTTLTKNALNRGYMNYAINRIYTEDYKQLENILKK